MLTRYTGTDLGWHPVYVDVAGTRVLTIVVDPPRWGDPIWTLRQTSEDPETGKELKEGTVFVRRPGTTVTANADDMNRLQIRADVPRPHLTMSVNWNQGASGDYVGVKIYNGVRGVHATIHEVGFAMKGIYTATAPGEEERSAYASLLISEEDRVVKPGETVFARVPLGPPPWMWENESEVFPYIYYDDGHRIFGNPVVLLPYIADHPALNDPAAKPMFETMFFDYVAPEAVNGLRGRMTIGDDEVPS